MAVKTSDPARILYDYKNWVNRIHRRAEEKVEEAVSLITNNTNTDYASDNSENAQAIGRDPIYYRMYTGKNLISGVASARPTKEFIYTEFGTRYTESSPLTIATGFKSGIDTLSIAAPYKSNKPRFINRKASGGTYYFLGNIDVQGIRFIRDFWK